jgi:hypothetical protein
VHGRFEKFDGEGTVGEEGNLSGHLTIDRSVVAVDRTAFAMTWSPLGMASREAQGEVTVRFVRR